LVGRETHFRSRWTTLWELADVVVVVITELVAEDDPLQFAEILADVFVVDVSIEMGDLVPVEVKVKANEVVTVDEPSSLQTWLQS
jgi:hypothetical protein